MTDDIREPSPHATALMRQLGDHEYGSPGVAVVLIPSSTFAAQTATRVAHWMAQRAATLRSIGHAVEELRGFGFALPVAHGTGAELGDARVDRLVFVEHLHRDGH